MGHAGSGKDRLTAAEDEQPRFFACLGKTAFEFFPPKSMLEALTHHSSTASKVGKAAAGVRAAGSNALKQVKRKPRVAGAVLRADDAENDDVHQPEAQPLVDGPRARGPVSGSAGADLVLAPPLACRLQDAILQGMGVLNEELDAQAAPGVLRPVASGRALYCADVQKSLVVWAATCDRGAAFYCSCGTESKDENVAALVRTGRSSTCAHASALEIALRGAAQHLRYASVPALLRAHPSLDNTKASPTDVETVMVINESDGKRVHVVGYNGIWSVVYTAPVQARRGRPVCANLPCRTRSTMCVHSCAVKPPQAGYGAFGDGSDADAGTGEENGDSDGSLADERTRNSAPALQVAPRQRSAAPNARKKGLAREFIDTDHVRRARNMLPCAAETAACRRWDKLARGEAVADEAELDCFEAHCIACGEATTAHGPAVSAELHTLSGLLHVWTFKRNCTAASCGKTVDFDGSSLGLFCYSEQTVYTRTFLDVILFTIISTKSSISAASAVSAIQLHCSGSVFAYDTAQSRQELSKATDQYSRTLIIPSRLFKCELCFCSDETPYLAVVVDGQTIGIFRDASFPFERVTANVPTIPVSIDNACAVSSAKVRKCVRQRLKAGFGERVTFANADQVAMAKFVSIGGVAPPFGDHDSAGHRAETAAWAACCFFNSFFRLTAVPRRGDTDGTAANPPCADDDSAGEGASKAEEKPTTSTAHVKYCDTIPSAIGGKELLAVVKRERWSIIYDFFSTFVAEPVIGVFVGCAVNDIKQLAMALVLGKSKSEWMRLSTCVHKLHVVWPALDLLANDMENDPELCRAFGELLMFALYTDQHMENLWRSKMDMDALRFEAQWTDTDAEKFQRWRQVQPGPPRLPSGLKAVAGSIGRAAAQAEEVRSGVVFPSLNQVRPHGTDAVAAEARRASKEQAEVSAKAGARTRAKVGAKAGGKVGAKRKRADMLHGGLGDDDCRHAFLTHWTFTPGVVSYVCSCGILIGFEVLESAESPAGIVSTLASRFARLPRTVYFDTACQSSRSATRRLPWLVRVSQTSFALDRFHAPPHKCSPIFDANNYPERSGMHKTSAAENRHSLNKPLKSHLTYLAQDRFVVQMRLIGAVNNLLIHYRRYLGVKDVRHYPLPAFFHGRIIDSCERQGCECRTAAGEGHQ